MWGLFSPAKGNAGGGADTPGRSVPVTPASCARATESRLEHTPVDRDKLVKVTFNAIHDSAPENSAMFLTGSLPSLGSWDNKRARKMVRASNGSWALAIYVPEKAEFLYQYMLIQDPDSQEPVTLWEGGLERKCKLVDSPDRSMILADDTRGDGTFKSTPTSTAKKTKEQPVWIPELMNNSVFNSTDKDEQIDALLKERERCQNELQKLKDIVGFTSNQIKSGELRTRDSYLPDTGPLYDTVRELQHFMFKKAADWTTLSQKIQEEDPVVPDHDVASVSHAGVQPSADTDKEREQATALALDECKQCIQDLEQQLAASQTARQQAEAELGEVQRKLAAVEQDLSATRSAREEARAVLEGKVRLAAGELGGIKEQHSLLQQSAAAMRAEMLQGMQELEDEMLHRTAATVEGIEEERTEALSKLQKEMLERKRLHNLVLDLKGNIRVFCRARPASEASKNALTFASESELLCEAAGKSHSFSYDCVFGPRSQQAEVFAEAHPLVVSVLDGFHACILAYGQTGSGKTHTMQGCPDHPGVNSRALCALFEMADERAATHSYQIKVSLLEIYNETLRDLLQPKDEASGKDKVLDVKLANTAADSAAAGCNTATCVPGVHVAEVGCMQDVLDALKRGEANRTVAGTDMNERSSRSHMVLSVYVEGTNVTSGVKTTGKLHLIDLAGSERLARSNAQGQQLKEAQNINKSLSALGDCIQSLVAKNKHVPFRNSKLTFLLQDSLAGDSKVLMIVCVACEEDNSNETLCSLNFAARARNVVLGPAKSKVSSAADVKLRERERELDNARDSLRRLEASKEELAAKLHDAAGLHDKELAELLAQLKAERCAHLKQKEVLQQLQVKHDEANDKLRSMQDKLRAMERRDDGGEEGEEAGEMGEEETEMAEMTGLEDADVSESKCEQEQKDQQQPSHLPQRSDQAEAAVTETPRWATPTLSSLAGAATKPDTMTTPRVRKAAGNVAGKSVLPAGNKENGDNKTPLNSARGRRADLINSNATPSKTASGNNVDKADKSDKYGAINDRLEARLGALRSVKMRDGMSSLPLATSSSNSSESKSGEVKGTPLSARKESRLATAPSRLATKTAEGAGPQGLSCRSSCKDKDKMESSKGRFSVGGWR